MGNGLFIEVFGAALDDQGIKILPGPHIIKPAGCFDAGPFHGIKKSFGIGRFGQMFLMQCLVMITLAEGKTIKPAANPGMILGILTQIGVRHMDGGAMFPGHVPGEANLNGLAREHLGGGGEGFPAT